MNRERRNPIVKRKMEEPISDNADETALPHWNELHVKCNISLRNPTPTLHRSLQSIGCSARNIARHYTHQNVRHFFFIWDGNNTITRTISKFILRISSFQFFFLHSFIQMHFAPHFTFPLRFIGFILSLKFLWNCVFSSRSCEEVIIRRLSLRYSIFIMPKEIVGHFVVRCLYYATDED